ncbi:Mediator of RNA polymerase II transcription subunit 19, partial [Trichostrongylus colubriformis]
MKFLDSFRWFGMGDGTWGPSLPSLSSPAISTLSLKTKISFKTGAATAVTVTPFYTLKPELPPKSPMLGSSDLLTAYDLGAVYSRYCGAKKMREDLNSFLPQIYGNFNFSQAQDI